MKLAVLQAPAAAGDVAANLATLDAALADARARRVDLLIAPELFLTGYWNGEAIARLAEPADGSTATELSALASRHGVALLAGLPERAGAKLYNAAMLAKTDGTRCVYRKRNLYGAHEKALFTPGDAPAPVVAIAGVNLGILICYDVEFPEETRALACAGADLIAVPTALPDDGDAATIAHTLVPCRAFENGCFLAYADLCGQENGRRFAGLSGIIGPDGQPRARAGSESRDLLVAEIDPAERRSSPYLRDLRTDYGRTE